MGILALDVGPLIGASLPTLGRREHGRVAAVHGTRHVAPLAVAFVVGDAAGVELLNGLHDALEVIAAATLVACTPAEDTDVVAKGADVSLVALDHRPPEKLDAGQPHVTVTLYIRLGKDIESVAVA